jgi:hypothetical protein
MRDFYTTYTLLRGVFEFFFKLFEAQKTPSYADAAFAKKTICATPQLRDHRICKSPGLQLGDMHFPHFASGLPMRSP